uniref:Uncharacterized protein n=1 Tax=Anopheles coluzzii TaxID=1518534 RepID=A0A8W7PXU0_ANOCL
MDRYLLSCLLLVCMVLAYPSEIAAQRSRVCFAQSGDYTTATSIGFCSHAVYIALNPTSKAFVGILNPANDADDLLGGIRKFANLKKTYPYVDLYMGVLGSISAGNILWLNQQASRKTFIDLLITKMASYPEMSGNWYALFVAELNTALTAKNLKLITALPWDASASGDIYYSSTLSTLPFNVIKTHEEMYSAVATTTTRPISPLFSLAAPFNDETKTIEVVPLLPEEVLLLQEEVPLLQEVVQQLLVVAPLLLEEALLHQTQHRQLRHQPVHHQPRLPRQVQRSLHRLLPAILR